MKIVLLFIQAILKTAEIFKGNCSKHSKNNKTTAHILKVFSFKKTSLVPERTISWNRKLLIFIAAVNIL